ncbi:MAG: hypothetical protein J0H79_07405 [Alphaproteobacteria bacterium]|nr:hypothetical protein [Alphaproteobacteria bacterium]OJU56982.1 MAG: hypothetical protein BGO00_07440 [Alphaproteobacteria bacterium 62-8]
MRRSSALDKARRDLSDNERREMTIAEADAAAAFEHIHDADVALGQIVRIQSALSLMMTSDLADGVVSDALILIVNVLETETIKLEDALQQASHKTWAYKFAPDKILNA